MREILFMLVAVIATLILGSMIGEATVNMLESLPL